MSAWPFTRVRLAVIAAVIIMIACAILFTPGGSDENHALASSSSNPSVDETAATPAATDTLAARPPTVPMILTSSSHHSIDPGEWTIASDSSPDLSSLYGSLDVLSLPGCLVYCDMTPALLAHSGPIGGTPFGMGGGGGGGGGGFGGGGIGGSLGFIGGGTGVGSGGTAPGLESMTTAGLSALGGPTSSGSTNNGSQQGNQSDGRGYGPTASVYEPPGWNENPGRGNYESEPSAPHSVPEPSTMFMTGVGALSLLIRSRFAQKRPS